MLRPMPNYSGYHREPVTLFQQRCSAYLTPYTGRNSSQEWSASYYYHHRKDGRPPVEVVQLYQHNWTLHVQAALHGDEEYEKLYQQIGLSADRVLITLDVECGPRDDTPYERVEICGFQKSIRNAIERADIFPSLTPAVLHHRGHHVVLEVAEYGASERFVSNVTARMIAYCETVYDIASSVIAYESSADTVNKE